MLRVPQKYIFSFSSMFNEVDKNEIFVMCEMLWVLEIQIKMHQQFYK